MFAFGVNNDYCDRNPAKDVPYIKTGSEGFHSWSLDEVEAFEKRHPVGTKARLALALLLYTAQRRSDVVLFGKQHVQDGWLVFTQVKNRVRAPVRLEIPIVAPRQSIIDASPVGDLTFLVTEFNRGFTANGFGNWFRDRCDEAGLPQCSAHGLRKAGATIAAENGATERQLMAIFGWSTIGKLAEIAENLHRRQIDDIERGELIAAWMELRQERKRTLADKARQPAALKEPGRGRGAKGGVRQAARDLGMPERSVRRALSVAALSTEAKAAARKAGVAGNQTVLLEVAKAGTPDLQVAVIRRGTEERLAAAPVGTPSILQMLMDAWAKADEVTRREFLRQVELEKRTRLDAFSAQRVAAGRK
ncbi:tyrosine-type recombinase/integrase [Chelatococcus asaccharovorans]|uniref:tyrosine-type recombinase/integrase n=1 Tax=Chelatococcus asaccharovorans TaxID=28210 RepID=UPI0014740F97|nr:tyrosine-type recombinase/integrase [Chelatococcus asaccharovorans]MBS7702665.1 tyrosine-type recombinase/integrase [Chelatococcus asaccharovorans]